MEAAGAVMQNPILVEKIVNALNYKSLKTCRSLNSLWYGEVTRVLKKKSVILVSRDTIPEIMNNDPNSTDILYKAVRINTSFSLGDTTWLLNFFRVYSKELEYIEWTDSGAICHQPGEEDWATNGDGERQFSVMYGWDYDLPNLTELNLKPTFAFGTNLTLILKSAPNLRILRVDCVPYDYYCVNEFKAALLAQTNLKNLKTLHFGKRTHLRETDIQMLIGLPNLELVEFMMEGRMFEIQSGRVFKSIMERWSDTLETVVFPTVLAFQLTKIMSRLKTLTAATLRFNSTLPINIQFPSLECFHVNLAPHFKFKKFIPPSMEPHENMRELSIIGEKLDTEQTTIGNVTRMFEKFPNLTVLSIPTTDEFLQTIYTSCPNLKSLYLRGSFTDVGVTGIPMRKLDNFCAILKTTGNIVGADVIEKYRVRRLKSILDLKQLETLSLSSEGVGDKSVLWGILGCTTKLKKLILPANVTDKSLDALMGMKELRDLCIPPPQVGHISFEAMKNFSDKMIHVHVQLRCGTNDPNTNDIHTDSD